jgi:hypothetical protein
MDSTASASEKNGVVGVDSPSGGLSFRSLLALQEASFNSKHASASAPAA